MIEAVTIETAHLLGDTLAALHRLRHKIFVERQKYEVATFRGMEWDAFDTPVAVYLLWRDESARVRAVARLIPTNFPYMIKELWPQLVDGGELPSQPDIWEVTRLGVDRSLPPAVRRRVFGEMLCGCGEFGIRNGLKEYYLVTHPKIIQRLRATGCTAELLGRAQALDRCTVAAAKVKVSPEALEMLRNHYGLPPSVLCIVGDAGFAAA
jgi:N-acyl-L-homoserine lactone synthetase